jgi:hypothetical protein
MTIFWRIKAREGSAYVVEFWTKKDKSNALTAKMVTTDEEKVRRMIVNHTGHTNFEMVFEKDKK